ncbi:4156_t:CDS:2, partial [Gigaspora rosea]
QQWDLAEFLETMELDEHKNRYVAGNHWGMFVLVEEDFSELDRFINQAKKVGVDINAVGSLDGTSIYDVDLDSVEVKLWRKPEADITDYFNSGFNEEITTYLTKNLLAFAVENKEILAAKEKEKLGKYNFSMLVHLDSVITLDINPSGMILVSE